jgi:hypothetical protein
MSFNTQVYFTDKKKKIDQLKDNNIHRHTLEEYKIEKRKKKIFFRCFLFFFLHIKNAEHVNTIQRA